MQDSWIPLRCTDCGTEMEFAPSELPPLESEFSCEHCGATAPVTDFVATQEGLKILETFQS